MGHREGGKPVIANPAGLGPSRRTNSPNINNVVAQTSKPQQPCTGGIGPSKFGCTTARSVPKTTLNMHDCNHPVINLYLQTLWRNGYNKSVYWSRVQSLICANAAPNTLEAQSHIQCVALQERTERESGAEISSLTEYIKCTAQIPTKMTRSPAFPSRPPENLFLFPFF